MENKPSGHQAPTAPIKDKEAYELYQTLAKHPILNEMSKITDSKGRIINLGMTSPNLRKNIADLPEVEQKKILALKQKHYDIMCKRNGAQRRAFNTVVNGQSVPIDIAMEKLESRKLDLIELFGKMFTCREVHQIVLENYNLKGINLPTIEAFRKYYMPEISNKIEEHKRSFSDIRLGYKRSRLEELSWMYMRRKRIYEITNKSDDHRLLLMTLEQIRKEAEGDMIKIDANLNLSMEEGIQQHINQNILKYINLKEIILARVAARANISPIKLINDINKSYYHDSLESSEVTKVREYPSLQTYDFDKINRQHQQLQSVPINVVEAEIVSSEVNKVDPSALKVEKKANSIKEILLEKLARRNSDLNLAKNNINSELIEKTNNI